MKLAVFAWVYGKVIAVPPMVSDHPAKVKLARVGAAGAAETLAPTFVVTAVTVLPL